MSHKNAADMNVECEKAMTTSLNDFVLLQVFSYLNLRDCINFAATSKRLKSVGALHFTKYKRFDLRKYEWCEQPNKLPAETILLHIGQHIKTLTITSIRSTVAKAVTDNCANVATLKIYNCGNASELKQWMQQLKLESLAIEGCIGFNEMSVRLEALKELHFTDDNADLTSMQLTNILEKTTELKTLTVDLLYPNFSYAVFTKLTKLQCVHIRIDSHNLVNLADFLQMDGLTRFKLRLSYYYDAEDLPLLNSFLEILAERSQLNELQLRTYTVDQNTFRILKSFHDVTSLGFNAWNDRWMIHQLVEAQPNLKHLDVLDKLLLMEEVDFMVKILVKLETFTFGMREKDLEQLNESRINEMLKSSTSRPMLTLCIKSNYSSAVKIELRFEQQRKHRIVQFGLDDSYFLTDRFVF